MKHWRWLLVCGSHLLATTLSYATPPRVGHPVVGKWQLQLPEGCTEIYEIRYDGTTHVFSATEESFSEFEVTDELTPEGYYVLVDTITNTNGLPDCLGHTVPVGDRSTAYLQPTSDGGFRMCFDPALTSCLGPLRRVVNQTPN
jgi:hypothetical protein